MQMSSKILLMFSYLFSSNDSIQHQLHLQCGPAPRIVFIHFTIIWTRSHRLQNWSLILQSVYNQPTSPPLSNLSGILWLCLFKVSQFLISSCENENKTRITTCLQSVWKIILQRIVCCRQSQVCFCWQRRVNGKCLCIELLPGWSRLLCKETLWPGSEHRWLSCSLSISQSRKHRSTAHNPEPDPLLKCNFLSKIQFQPNH